MSKKSNSITINLFRLDIEALKRRLENIDRVEDIPEKLVARYNSDKKQKNANTDNDAESYSQIEVANNSEFAKTNKLMFYKKNQFAFVSHSWVNFFKKQDVDLGEVKVTVPHIVCFVVKDDEMYAITTGSAYVIFESFIDQIFPIEIAKRILKPEVKGGKQHAISGEIQAADVYFRRPVRIGLSDSHQEVWKNLSGSLLSNVQNSEAFKKLFGKTKSVNIQIKASIKFSSRIEDPSDLIKFIEWIKEVEKIEPSETQKQAFAFYDSIRPLSNRRDKDLIEQLCIDLSNQFLAISLDDNTITLSNEKNSQFINADKFILYFNSDMLHEWKYQPSTSQIAEVIKQNKEKLPEGLTSREILEKLRIFASYEDDKWENTEGTILQHLSGEHILNGNCYYLLNGEWFQVERSFQEVTDSELKDILKVPSTVAGLSHQDMSLTTYSHADEGEYNQKQASDKVLCCDKVFYMNLELSDLLYFGNDNYIYIIHVKRGFGASTRDAASQLRNSMNSIENDLRLPDNPVLNTYYQTLVSHGRINPTNLTKEQFIAFFKRKRRYIFSYVENEELTDTSVVNITSSIAKNELVSLVQFSKRLSTNAELKIVWIPKEQQQNVAA